MRLFRLRGILNNDGDLDVLLLSTSVSIYYMKGMGLVTLTEILHTYIDAMVAGTPDHALICDLDQDGDQDLLVSLVQ